MNISHILHPYILFSLLSALTALAGHVLAEPIKIGAIFSLSGFGADSGQGDLNGALMACDEINATGGVTGRTIELLVEDSRSDQKVAVSAFNKLLSVDKVVALVGPNYTEFTEVIFPLADQHKLPTLAPSGYPEAIFNRRQGQNHFSFVLWPEHEAALRPLLDKITVSKYKNVALLSAENAYYELLRRLTTEELSKRGIQVRSFTVGAEMFDLRSIITAIRSSSAQAVIIYLMETGQIGAFFRQAKELGLARPVYAENHIIDDVLLAKDRSLANGTIFFQYPIAGSADFARRYRERFGSDPKFTSAKSYDALYLMKNAISTCGMQPARIRECLAKADYQGASGHIRFDSRGALAAAPDFTRLYTIKAGKIVPLED